MTLIRGGILLVLLSVLQACSDGKWYEKSYDIPGGVWSYKDTLTFEIEATDTLSFNTIDLSVEYDENEFSYQNLYVNIATTYPDQKVTNQVVSLEILGDEAQLARDCSGEKCTVNILLMGDFKFREPGKYKISIVQHSREQKLKGIYNMSLTVKSKV